MLGEGVHVLCNDRLGSPDFPKADKARERVMSLPADTWSRLKPQLVDVLADGSLPESFGGSALCRPARRSIRRSRGTSRRFT